MSSNPRRMIYPYTLTAKIAQFPYSYYWKYCTGYRIYIYGIIGSLPIFVKLTTLINSPGNVAAWEKKKQKDHEEHLRHLEHLH